MLNHFLRTIVSAALLFSFHCGTAISQAADWPMLGRDASRNAVNQESKPPTDWQVEERDIAGKRVRPPQNIKWQADLGSHTFGDPVVANGLVWVGTNNWQPGNEKAADASVLACFRESDGKPLFRYASPRLPQGRDYDWPFSALACSPLVEGERIWFTTNRAEVVCLDVGPLMRGDGQPREIWKVDMMGRFGVKPAGSRMTLCHFCSIASYKDRIYVITGNGVDESHTKIPAPLAPSVICFKKGTGDVVWQDNSPGANIHLGQWSSPLVIETVDRAQVVVPQGDGWLRSFEAKTGKLLWKFDINFKTSKLTVGGRGTRNDVIATPVLYDGHVYVASGQYAEHGEGLGRLVCIDSTKTGDISSELAVDAAGQPLPENRLQAVDVAKDQRAVANPHSGLIWEYIEEDRSGNGKFEFEEQFHRTSGSVCIKNNLLVVTDFSGLTHCLNAKTGKLHWTYDNLAACHSSPLIVEDKIYVTDEDGDVTVFALSADPKVAMRSGSEGFGPLAEIYMGQSIYCSPVYANGVLYIASKGRLFAIQNPGEEVAGYWPQWRGLKRDNQSTDWGLLQEWPAEGPPMKWRTDGIGRGIASMAIDGGSIYTMGSAGEHEYVIAVNETDGELRWKSSVGPAINDAPLMRWLIQNTPTVDDDRLYVSTAEGNLICFQTADGTALWRKNYREDFGSPGRGWKFVDWPLVDGEHLICTPGGLEAAVVALNKRTGAVVWKCVTERIESGAYGATIATDLLPGGEQYIVFTNRGLVGVGAKNGKMLWRYDGNSHYTANSHTAIVADKSILSTNGYGAPLAVLTLTSQNGKVEVREDRQVKLGLDAFQDGNVRLGDYLYMSAYNGLLVCVNWRTGAKVWGPSQLEGRGKSAITYADDRFYVVRADGTCLLVDASPMALQSFGHFKIPDHEPSIGATFPVVTRGRLYIRDNDHLFCYGVRAKVDAGKKDAPRNVKINLTAGPVPTGVARDRSHAKNKQPDAIFVPTPHDVVAKMLEMAAVKKTDTVYDLGSGDGRIVIAAAKQFGSKAVGVELDKDLVRVSTDNIKQAEMGNLAEIEHADIFQRDLSSADVIALYLTPHLMDRLLPQLAKVKPGTRIVSHFFKFTDIPPDKSLQFDSRDDGDKHEIYLWTAPVRTPAR